MDESWIGSEEGCFCSCSSIKNSILGEFFLMGVLGLRNRVDVGDIIRRRDIDYLDLVAYFIDFISNNFSYFNNLLIKRGLHKTF
jgi:hypothetical protein